MFFMDVIKTIKMRQSIRKFKSKSPTHREVLEAIHAAQYAPMAGKIFSLYFVVIDDKKIIQKIAELSNQEFIKDVKWIVVVVSNPDTTEYFPGNAKKFQYQQAGAAIQNFMLSLTNMGLATCWVGEFPHEKIMKLLKIEDGYEIEGIFPIGYPYNKPKENTPKSDIYNILAFNNWNNERLKKSRPVEGRFFGRKIDKRK